MIRQHSKHNQSTQTVPDEVQNVFSLSCGLVPQAPSAVLERQPPGAMPEHGNAIALPSQPQCERQKLRSGEAQAGDQHDSSAHATTSAGLLAF